jgi:hypothetical protein
VNRANHLAWFGAAWRERIMRMRVLGEYAALRQSPLVLADIALRGGIDRPAFEPGDPYKTAWNDGRRALAQEILELAKIDPRTVFDTIDALQRQPQGERR